MDALVKLCECTLLLSSAFAAGCAGCWLLAKALAVK